MLHILDPFKPGYFLCGQKMRVYVGYVETADCVVCEDLRGQ
jgi:hypothetical protein